ncbi:MAG: TLC domain-containing protein [archaeon]|nr:TLC domain-containing protein [archaeon]
MWWYWVYDEETLSSIQRYYPGAWRHADGPYTMEHFVPSWQEQRGALVPPLIAWTLIWAAVMTVLRSVLVTHVFEPFARRRVPAAGYGKREVVKFCESATRFSFYSLSSAAVVYTTLQQDFFYHPWKAWWVAEPLPEALYYLYIMELAWYFHQTFVHLFLDERKKDFAVMLSHHFITLSLLYLSFFVGYHRIALLVLFAHDPCDPFLEAGKMFNYLAYRWSAIFSFVGLVASWFLLRLVFYPTLLYTCIIESIPILGPEPLGFWFFATLIFSLQVLHLYWFVLITKVGIAVATKPHVRGTDFDDREYSDAELRKHAQDKKEAQKRAKSK